MAKKRFLNTRFWNDGFVVKLSPLARYFFIYLLTNEHTAICGIYELPLTTIKNETGLDKELPGLFEELAGRFFYTDDWVCVKNYAKHNIVNGDCQKGANREIAEIPADILKRFKTMEQKPTPCNTVVHRVGQSDILTPTPTPIPNGKDKKATLSCKTVKPVLPSGKELSIVKPKNAPKSLAELEATVSRIDKNIFITIELFRDINPSYERFFENKTQRSAAAWLAKKYPLNKIEDLVRLAKFCNSKPYCPAKAVVHSPQEMERNMADMVDFYRREKTKDAPERVLDLTDKKNG